jgi:SAM-dependent methyltransferase
MATKQINKWGDSKLVYNNELLAEKMGVFEYERKINTTSLKKMLPNKAKRVLDMGSGGGLFASFLAQKYKAVTVHESIKYLLNSDVIKQYNLTFKIFDLERPFPRFDHKFDLIIAKLVLMYIKNIDNFASECQKIISENGILLISVTHPVLWYTRYLENKFNIKKNKNYNKLKSGYFSELIISKRIGGNKNLEFEFINRTISTYVNTFSKYGFKLTEVGEPKISKSFIEKFPNFKHRTDVPLRLNLKFQKATK